MPDLSLTKSEKSFLSSKGYRLFKTIGLGTDSIIYLANYESIKTGSRYYLACKVYDEKKIQPKYVMKFLPREIDALINLSHPYIIQIHSIFRWRTKYYIFMRYAERGDLFDYIKYNGCIKEKQARIWYTQLCLALKYLHTLDIAHRDLKCENILLTRNYNIKLADFGFCRNCRDEDGEIAMCETYCGSLLYTCPEIIRGTPYQAKPADMWALGVILYVMVNRSMPFYEENIKKLYELQMASKWKFKSKIADDLSTEVKHLISNLLLPEPESRYNIDEVLNCDWIMQGSIINEIEDAEEEPVPVSTIKKQIVKSKLKRQESVTDVTPMDILECKSDSDCHIIKNISEVLISDPVLTEISEPEVRTQRKRKCCII